jgi:hypothetical protein
MYVFDVILYLIDFVLYSSVEMIRFGNLYCNESGAVFWKIEFNSVPRKIVFNVVLGQCDV